MEEFDRTSANESVDQKRGSMSPEESEDFEAIEGLKLKTTKKSRVPRVLRTPKVPKTPVQEELFKQEDNIYNLSDEELINLVHVKELQLKHIILENQILFGYLQDNDPTELEGYENLINAVVERVERQDIASFPSMSMSRSDFVRSSMSHARRSIKHDSKSSLNITSILEGRVPKINVSHKSDMTLKAMEEIQASLEVFMRKMHKARRNLKAELEEYTIREKDIRESIDSFEFNILVQAVDPLTQRIPAEKFLRWMEDWLKSAQQNIEKLRLRTGSMKVQLSKVSATLMQRRELGKNVHAVDFDQLQIENKHFRKKLNQKNHQLMEMKKMSGNVNLILNNHKKDLCDQQEEYNFATEEVTSRKMQIDEMVDECTKIELELAEAKKRYNNFKKLTMTYKVPDVMDYFNLKCQLNDAKNKVKVCHRRRKVQSITMEVCLRSMRTITGSSKIDPVWLECLPIEETTDSNEESEILSEYE